MCANKQQHSGWQAPPLIGLGLQISIDFVAGTKRVPGTATQEPSGNVFFEKKVPKKVPLVETCPIAVVVNLLIAI